MQWWETLDVEALLALQHEQTTTANVGAFAVPLGAPLRRTSVGPLEVPSAGGAHHPDSEAVKKAIKYLQGK